MLRLLRIRDFALIRSLEVEFSAGLNLLTGETGSGKSIIVDALSLLTGERASPDVVRTDAKAAVLEAVFSPDSNKDITGLLTDAGINAEEDSILIHREISSGGRSRIYINNSLATLSLLKSVGELLVDIHGQTERQSLLSLTSHLTWLDRFAANLPKVAEIRSLYHNIQELAAELESLQIDEQERLRKLDILRFQLEEIRRAKLQPGEIEQLQNERKILSNKERILSLANEGHELLYESTPSLISQNSRLVKIAQELENFDPSWITQREALQDCLYKLEDIAYIFRDYSAGIDSSPERLAQIEQRIEDLERLAKKYGPSVEEIQAHASRCERELEDLASLEDKSKALADKFQQQLEAYMRLAENLSDKRRKDARSLEREMRKEFQQLSLEKMELSVQFQARGDAEKTCRIPSCCGPGGLDRIEFMVSANKGEEKRPMAKIASGGELSRVMLAIRTLCGGGDTAKTLVFDEVDAGIGGRVAEVVGRRLHRLSAQSQVLCVTHLPQIAAFAGQHFRVGKKEVASRTETFIEALDASERILEIARMLGGETITEITRRHAREMLENSIRIPGATAAR
jgi:DNA repair protein RecN (Recombination protein N)